MIAVCKKIPEDAEGYLTFFKEYKIIENKSSKYFVCITDDADEDALYPREYFEFKENK